MATVDDLKARESEKSRRARARLQSRVDKSEKVQHQILSEVMGHTIVDKLVDPSRLTFYWGTDSLCMSAFDPVNPEISAMPIGTVHSHAMGQLADIAGLTRTYMRRLADSKHDWMHKLLVHNLEELYDNTEFLDRKGKRKRFLVRLVSGNVRGFLSQNFNRKLMTAPLLKTFIEKCRELGAGPVETTATDVRVRVKYMLPYVFEPVEGEFVAFGVTFGNSDFGAGRLSVSGTVQRITSGTTAVLSDKYSRTHLGSVIQDSDIEMSKATADKELDAVRSAIGDAVSGLLGTEALERNIKLIEAAHDKEIPWHQLKNRLSGLLGKDDISLVEHLLHGGASVVDLPPVQTKVDTTDGSSTSVPTAWWAANTVSSIADSVEDPDRKAGLQDLAGQLMTG